MINTLVESLGQGKDTMLIRKTNTILNEFLLYHSKLCKQKGYLDTF